MQLWQGSTLKTDWQFSKRLFSNNRGVQWTAPINTLAKMNGQFFTMGHETFRVFNATRWRYTEFVLRFLNRLSAPYLRINIHVPSFANYQNSPVISCYRTWRFIHLLWAFWCAFPPIPWRKSLIIIEAWRSHTHTHHTRFDSSGRRRPLYLTAHNTHNPPPGFEPAITGSERLKAHALDRAAPGCGVPQ